MNFGKRLNSFRTQAGLSQKELGVRLGYPASTAEVRVAQYESGGRHPRKETVDSMANALGISPHALTVPAIESDTELMHLLFALEDEYRLKPSLVFGTFCLHMDRSTDSFLPVLEEWCRQAGRLERGEISQEEYDLWRYNLT